MPAKDEGGGVSCSGKAKDQHGELWLDVPIFYRRHRLVQQERDNFDSPSVTTRNSIQVNMPTELEEVSRTYTRSCFSALQAALR